MDEYKYIVRYLHEERLRMKINQGNLSHKIGIAESTLSKWECGYRKPSVHNLIAWCESLECRILVEKYPYHDS